jgi:hypothetical protein
MATTIHWEGKAKAEEPDKVGCSLTPSFLSLRMTVGLVGRPSDLVVALYTKTSVAA